MTSLAFFEQNCPGSPTASLLADLVQLARDGKLLALTCFKQLFTSKQNVWFACAKSDRVAAVSALVALLEPLGHTPLLSFVAARGLYLESLFSALRLSDVIVVRQVLRAVKDDIALVCEEKMSGAELEARASPIWNNWQPLLRATWAVFSATPAGAPAALECVRVTRLLLVDLNGFRKLSPAIATVEPIRQFLTQLAKQLHSNAVAEVMYQRASWKLLHGVLLSPEALFPELTETIAVSFLPSHVSRRSVARFLGAALDHPRLREEPAARVLSPARLEQLVSRMAESLLVADDVVEAASDWCTTLGADLLDEDDFYTLMIVVGRNASVRSTLQQCLSRRLGEAPSLSPERRAALYTCLECCSEKPFALVESILARERGLFAPATAATTWPVFRACAKLIESCAFACVTPAQFDASLSFLLFVLGEKSMSVIAKVHAAVSLRALVEWQRVAPAGHVAERLAACSARLCFGVSELFRSCYAEATEEPMEDDLAEGVLLQLLPLQAELMTRVAPAEVIAVCFNILTGVASLWAQDVPELVRIQLLRTLEEVLATYFQLLEQPPAQQFLPSLRELLSDATRRHGTASEALNVLALLALKSSVADRAEVREFAVALLSSRWTPATVLEEVALPRMLEGLLACEQHCESSQEAFFFAKRLGALLAVAAEPPLCGLLFVARMHALYLRRLRVAVVDNVAGFVQLLQRLPPSREAAEAVALLQQPQSLSPMKQPF